MFSLSQLTKALRESRQRVLDLVSDLSDEQLMGPRLAIINPLLWEIGHAAYFQEFWALRHLRQEFPILSTADTLYDSARIAHDTRWDLLLPSRAETLDYLRKVLGRVVEVYHEGRVDAHKQIGGYDETYFLNLVLFHECMHAEAIAYTRQTLSYPLPRFTGFKPDGADENAHYTSQESLTRSSDEKLGDAPIPGGTFLLGNAPDCHFVFDNEQWAHPVRVKPFSISRTAVTNAEFETFVSDKGYERREFWSDEGWQWRERLNAKHPVYWQLASGGRWLRRNSDQWVPLEEHLPVLHVNWYEADAFCRWTGRRLPTEAEWEMAASTEPATDGRGISLYKRRYPWGDDPPTPDHANLDWQSMGCVDVTALPAGDSAFGCRQMIGNVWEWTATDFGPYPGFAPGPYKEYSAPWFGDHKVLRGGCWATRSGMITNTYRNFYKPDRRDVWAGFRTCVS